MNIAMLLDMAADGFGDRRAVVSPGGRELTYTALRDAAAQAAKRLGAGSQQPHPFAHTPGSPPCTTSPPPSPASRW